MSVNVWRISSELQNIFLPDLVWWCSIMSQSVLQKFCVVIFKVGITARAHVTKIIWLFLLYLWTVGSLATKLGGMMHHHKPECLVEKRRKRKKEDKFIHGQGHSEGSKCQCWSRCYLLSHLTFCCQTCYCDASSWARVHAKRWVCCFQGQGHSKGSYDQSITVSTITAELIILLSNLVW